MKTLTLLRHAKSSWSDTSLADHERPLNRRGERDVPAMAVRIQDAGVRPSLIISSPAVRTWATAKTVARQISYPIEFLQREAELYLANLNSLLDIVAEQDVSFNSIMIVGHNPGLTEFANFLHPGLTRNLPTCGVVSFSIDAADWNLRREHELELAYYDYPKRQRTPSTQPH